MLNNGLCHRMKQATKIIAESGVVLFVEKRILDDMVEVALRMEGLEECLLHWGLRHHAYAPWQVPPRSVWPEDSRAFNHTAVQTAFLRQNGYGQIIIRLPRSMDFRLIDFVLYFPEKGRWDNNHGRNYQIEISEHEVSFGNAALASLANEIIEKEVSRNSWSLMHRFNLCYDLLDKIKKNDMDGLALIFVWLRFSAIRQLDWQRNYNTTPGSWVMLWIA